MARGHTSHRKQFTVQCDRFSNWKTCKTSPRRHQQTAGRRKLVRFDKLCRESKHKALQRHRGRQGKWKCLKGGKEAMDRALGVLPPAELRCITVSWTFSYFINRGKGTATKEAGMWEVNSFISPHLSWESFAFPRLYPTNQDRGTFQHVRCSFNSQPSKRTLMIKPSSLLLNKQTGHRRFSYSKPSLHGGTKVPAERQRTTSASNHHHHSSFLRHGNVSPDAEWRAALESVRRERTAGLNVLCLCL